MLESVTIAGTASYPESGQCLAPCKEINFIFGTNGTGKTTISRVIANPEAYPKSILQWKDGKAAECFVFNSDFASRNFASNMPGIFTLGDKAAHVLEEINLLKHRRAEAEKDLSQLRRTLQGEDGMGGKLGEAKNKRNQIEDQCWKAKTKHDTDFKNVFEGVRNSKTNFCDKLLEEYANNEASIVTLVELRTRAETVFQESLEIVSSVPVPLSDDLLGLEQEPLLAKKIVGKEDVDIATLIVSLGNSDWVKEGQQFLARSGDNCPFCQQKLLTDLRSELEKYFDETFTADMAGLQRIKESYDVYANALIHQLEQINSTSGKFIDNDAFTAEIESLKQRREISMRILAHKVKEPSASVILESLADLIAQIKSRLETANLAIAKHNAIVKNLSVERSKLIGEVWKYVVEDSRHFLDAYAEIKSALDKAAAGLQATIRHKAAELSAISSNIIMLERSITSVQPTVNEINGILASFGFTGFSLKTAGENEHLYAIVRPDGTEAATTLSEGEKSFLTFLYFYHLLKGSVTESGTTHDRIVVFDDPISSLDSDVLFIVSTLIKRVLNEACGQKGSIKQVFVLTHNIYFHKEVAFDSQRREDCRSHESFWIVRKRNNKTGIENFGYNPIKTSYELLWSEVRNPQRSVLTIQNTLRRILENYFKILGNLDKNDIAELFEGREKQICGSLFAWINDGSHTIHDDLYVSVDEATMEAYLKVFKNIFEKTGHEGHYRMMMRLEPVSAFKPANAAIAA
jgi:wobble nucleotide-excising tRNase